MKVCLFDVDGTLVNSSAPVLRSLNSALDDVGLEHITTADLGRIVGPPLRATFETLVRERGAGPETVERLLTSYRDVYRTVSIDLAATYPGVRELLDELAGTTRLAVVTSKPTEYAIPILDALGFSPMMEVMEGPSLSETEPKTETLARTLRRLNVFDRLDEVAMIGDRHHDIDAGRANGVATIGVTWGFGSRTELAGALADNVVETPADIARIVQSPMAADHIG
jgi:phosphoglycolate phosphatase